MIKWNMDFHINFHGLFCYGTCLMFCAGCMDTFLVVFGMMGLYPLFHLYKELYKMCNILGFDT